MGKALKDEYVNHHYLNPSSFWPRWTLSPPYGEELPEEFKKKSAKRLPAKRKAAAAKSRARKQA